MIRRTRIILAALVFVGITILFLDVSGVLHTYLGWLAKVQFLPAVLSLNVVVIIALLLLTLLFGRIYCSVICPLGILQDLLARLRPRKNKKVGRYTYSPEVRWLRYPVLVLFIVAIVAGVGSFVAFLAPYSSFGRIAANLFKPVYIAANNLFAGVAEHYDSYAFYHIDNVIPSWPTFVIALVSLIILAVLAWIGGRTYCNTICPVGTTLGLFSRFSLFKIHFDEEKCRNCSACTKSCKASCIDFKNHTVDYSRCVVCGNCLEACKFGALKYGKPDSPPALPVREGAVTSKRESLQPSDDSAPSLARLEETLDPSRTGRAGGESLRLRGLLLFGLWRPVGLSLALELRLQRSSHSLAGGHLVQRHLLDQVVVEIGCGEIHVHSLDVGSRELILGLSTVALHRKIQLAQVAKFDTIAVEHQLFRAAHQLHEDGDDVTTVVVATMRHHVVSKIVDAERAATLKKSVGLLGLVRLLGISQEHYSIINHDTLI